jgi:hypothetical protein
MWAAFQGAIVAVLGPVGIATFGFLTWSNTRWDGVPDNAPKKACALILFVSPALVVVATIYLFSASAAVRWLRIRHLPGLLGVAILVSLAFATNAALRDPFGQGGETFIMMLVAMFLPLAIGSVVSWWRAPVER